MAGGMFSKGDGFSGSKEYTAPPLPKYRIRKGAGNNFSASTMKLTAISIASLMMIVGHAGAFMLPLEPPRQYHYFDLRGKTTTAVQLEGKRTMRPASQGALLARENDPEVTVFDAEGAVSWDDYKLQKAEEFKASVW